MRFEQSFEDTATKLALPGVDDPKVDPVEPVTSWLSEVPDHPWLVILDNADDLETMFGPQQCDTISLAKINSGGLAVSLPWSSVGSMIITTRDRRVGERLTQTKKPIPVEPFSITDAQSLLRRKLHEGGTLGSEANELLELLDYLPLAITQATAFIEENNITIGEYTDLIQAGGAETMELLSTDQYDPGRDPENGNSVFQTWKMSFDQIRKTKPRAADILSLISVLDRQGISGDLLKEEIKGNLHLVTAIGTLKTFSLTSEEKGKAVVYGLHRTVQLATRNWREIQGELSRWQEIACR